MKKRKEVLFFLIYVVLISSVLSCSDKNDVIKLNFWHCMDGKGGECIDTLVNEFNEGIGRQKKIRINPVYIDWPGTTALTPAMISNNLNNLPDVLQLYGELVSVVSTYENVLWAEELISSDISNISKSDILTSALSAFTINEKLLSVPLNISTLLMYYNLTYLKEAGYDNPPATFDELIDMLPALKEKTNAEYGLHVRIGNYELENFVTNQGDAGYYYANNKSGRDGPVTKLICEKPLHNFLCKWDSVINTGTVNFSTRSTTEEFATGIDAIAFMTGARISIVGDLIGDSFEWGVAPIPLVDKNDVGASATNGASVVMFKRDDIEREKAMWTFIEYLVSPQAQIILMRDMGYIPLNIYSAENSYLQELILAKPQLKILTEVLKSAPSSAITTFFPNFGSIDSIIVDEIMKQGEKMQNSDTTCFNIIDKCNKVLEEYYRINQIKN